MVSRVTSAAAISGLPQFEQGVATEHGTNEDAVRNERFLDLRQSPCIYTLFSARHCGRVIGERAWQVIDPVEAQTRNNGFL